MEEVWNSTRIRIRSRVMKIRVLCRMTRGFIGFSGKRTSCSAFRDQKGLSSERHLCQMNSQKNAVASIFVEFEDTEVVFQTL